MRNLFQSNDVWSVALYTQNIDFCLSKKLFNPLIVFNSKKLRGRVQHIHTRADPFLFVWNKTLYIFFESVSIGEHGCIALYMTTDLERFNYLGVVLKESHHLSYPMVFESGSSVYMIPESGATEEVALYRFEFFPAGLKKIRVLLVGCYSDSSILFHNGLWYLFAASARGLELFYTDDIEFGTLLAHPASPVTVDPRVSRCGGQPVVVDGVIYRLAQDCSIRYGGNLNIVRILELTPSTYEEVTVLESYFSRDEVWNSEGGHHLSIVNFLDRTVIAVDGLQKDYLANKLLSPVFSALAMATI